MTLRRRRPRTLYPEGRLGTGNLSAYAVELFDTPKGVYVQRKHASHGCLLRWSVLKGALRRGRKRGWTT